MAPASAATPTPPAELSVLVIEDDRQLLRTLRDILDRRGYHPLTANSAREGLALVEQELPAVALVDLKLPDMDGVEVIDRLAALSQLTQTIVLTGNATIESALRALRQRTYDYLVKPVPPEKLLTTIDRAGERWQRRRAEEALRQSEERAQLLLEHISDVVMVVDDRLVVRYVSPSVRHLLDYQPSDILGRPCLDLVHPEDAAATGAFLRGASSRIGAMPAHQLRVRPRRGDWRLLEIGATSLAGRTDMGSVLLTGRDVTDRRRMEQTLQQVQRMDSIGQLAGGVAHDFNNILTAILGFSEILLDDAPAGSDARLDLEAIQKAAQHGASLSRQLLAFSRRQMLDLKILDIGVVVRDFERMIARVLGEHIRWRAHSDRDLWHVKADRGQLEQVLMNLAVNARDAMPDGGTLTLETRNATIDDAQAEGAQAQVTPGAYVRLTVRDTGVGMDADTQARIFEPFFTTKAPGRGTGLGLATVYGIVKQSGGFIEVESEPGQGTTFQIYLPAAAEATAEANGTTARAATPVESASILLIEDDAALRRLLVRSLERVGHRVRDAADTEEALAIVQSEPQLDLLITDAILPGQSGPFFARQVESERPALRVLFISGYSDDAILRLGLLNEQEAFLQKPFGPRTFVQKVQQVLRG